jgi:hypothetical protein
MSRVGSKSGEQVAMMRFETIGLIFASIMWRKVDNVYIYKFRDLGANQFMETFAALTFLEVIRGKKDKVLSLC